MSDVKLEDDVRRTLRAVADALVVHDRDFDPGRVATVEPPEPFRDHRNRRLMLLAAAIVVVLVAGTLIVRQTTTSNSGIKVAGSPTSSTAIPTTTATPTTASGGGGPIVGSQPAPADLVAKVVTVPVSALDAVGAGTAPLPTGYPNPMLTENGKPRLLWIGADYCPYCAAERWPLIVALARFGTFSGLRVTTSAADDVFPDTPTFSFHGSSYTSPYVALDAVETATNVPTDYAPTCPAPGACTPLAAAGYTALDTPTADERALYETYDVPPYATKPDTGAIPFLDLANRFVTVGATYGPQLLAGKTFDEIAAALSDPTSAIAKAVDGRANVITALICQLTHDQPGTVCGDAAIAAIVLQMSAQNGPSPTGPTS